MTPKPEHTSPLVPEERELPVEPDEGQVPPNGIPADPDFERVVPPEE
jgi:hypothetical protein